MTGESAPVRSFGERLAATFAASGHLCVGVDPHSYLLSLWGLPDTAAGAREFGLRVVDAASAGVRPGAAAAAGIIKPQVAFFERFGSAGYAALEAVLAAARHAGLVVIADAKRGDVGSTVDAYAQAWLAPGSPLEADAMTVSAYQGVGSLASAMTFAESFGKGLFVLAATSNLHGSMIQRARVQENPSVGLSVARAIINDVALHNRKHAASSASHGQLPVPGSVGVVLGATANLSTFGIDTATDLDLVGLPVLAPGFGHQGAEVSALGSIYGLMAPSVIVTESRSILVAGPAGINEAVIQHSRKVADAVGRLD